MFRSLIPFLVVLAVLSSETYARGGGNGSGGGDPRAVQVLVYGRAFVNWLSENSSFEIEANPKLLLVRIEKISKSLDTKMPLLQMLDTENIECYGVSKKGCSQDDQSIKIAGRYWENASPYNQCILAGTELLRPQSVSQVYEKAAQICKVISNPSSVSIPVGMKLGNGSVYKLYYPIAERSNNCWFDIQQSTSNKKYYITYLSNPETRFYCASHGETFEIECQGSLGENCVSSNKAREVIPLDDGNFIYKEEGVTVKITPAFGVTYQAPLNFEEIVDFWNLKPNDVDNCKSLVSYPNRSPVDFKKETPIIYNKFVEFILSLEHKQICNSLAPLGQHCDSPSRNKKWYDIKVIESGDSACTLKFVKFLEYSRSN